MAEPWFPPLFNITDWQSWADLWYSHPIALSDLDTLSDTYDRLESGSDDDLYLAIDDPYLESSASASAVDVRIIDITVEVRVAEASFVNSSAPTDKSPSNSSTIESSSLYPIKPSASYTVSNTTQCSKLYPTRKCYFCWGFDSFDFHLFSLSICWFCFFTVFLLR